METDIWLCNGKVLDKEPEPGEHSGPFWNESAAMSSAPQPPVNPADLTPREVSCSRYLYTLARWNAGPPYICADDKSKLWLLLGSCLANALQVLRLSALIREAVQGARLKVQEVVDKALIETLTTEWCVNMDDFEFVTVSLIPASDAA
ncbi:hypothetical protein B7463_g10022, partial [Scytalidium lignicola]